MLALALFYFISNSNEINPTEKLREQHRIALENSPFKDTKELSKKERKKLALPPNAYNEQMWDLTLDPATGRPMPERVSKLQENLRKMEPNTRGVGGDLNNPWISRNSHVNATSVFGNLGPIGGRTRGIMFDPNDFGAGNGDGTDYNRVFAGGVSGGLWVNNDITDSNSSWTLVPGIGANIAVTVIISDPNSLNTFYIGAGESYTQGAAIGNGIWKSTDAGVTWSHIFGGYTGTSATGADGFPQVVDGIFYINDLIARDAGGSTTELFASVASSLYANGGGPNQGQWNGLFNHGLYKSSNNGSNWAQIGGIPAAGNPSNPNDLEIDINNNVWLSTTNSSGFASNGGDIYRSTDGSTFTLMHTVPNTSRTEIEVSQSDADELWVLSRNTTTGLPELIYTMDAFTGTSSLSLPVDADAATIPANDFTRGQSWYDLEIEADASGNLIIGGIDLFRSVDNGTLWSQISEWYNIGGLTASLVHADQQAIVFRPGTGNGNKVVFGCDGGIYYSDNVSTAAGTTNGITSRNKDYSTQQYYFGAIDELDGADGDDIIGGAQDNGTSFIIDGTAGTNIFSETFGGDGAFVEIDAASGYVIQSYFGNDHNYVAYPSLNTNTDFQISSGTGGSFINVAALDENLDILYNASSTGGTFRVERNAGFAVSQGSNVRTQLTDTELDGTPTAMKVSPFNLASTELYVGLNSGKLLRVDNANGTDVWTDISGSGFVGSISDIEFGVDATEIFVTMHNYGVTSVWFTTLGGGSANWINIEGDLPDLPVKAILQNPLEPEQVIIGTSLGVWATNDYTAPSPNWIQAYNGMSDVPVLDLDLRPSDNVILASTHGRGMFTSQFTSGTLNTNDVVLNEDAIIIYPIVSDGNFTLKTNRVLGEIDFSVYDLSGKEVYTDKFSLNSNKKEFVLTLNSGVYLTRIQSNKSAVTKKIIIK